MADNVTWKIVATPAARWALANVLLHKDLTFKTRKESKELHRARLALGLYPPTNVYTNEKKGTVENAFNKEPSLFTVNDEVKDFIVRSIERIELPSMQLAQIEPILQQLEDRTHAKEEVEAAGPDVADWDEKAEDWTPTAGTVVDDPQRLIDVVTDNLRRAQGEFDKFTVLMLEDVRPERPGKAAGRLATNGQGAGVHSPS